MTEFIDRNFVSYLQTVLVSESIRPLSNEAFDEDIYLIKLIMMPWWTLFETVFRQNVSLIRQQGQSFEFGLEEHGPTLFLDQVIVKEIIQEYQILLQEI